jgi:hypothetical protein
VLLDLAEGGIDSPFDYAGGLVDQARGVTEVGLELLLELAPTDLSLLRTEHDEAGRDSCPVRDRGSYSLVHDLHDTVPEPLWSTHQGSDWADGTAEPH